MVSIPLLHNMALKSTWVESNVEKSKWFLPRFKLFQFLLGVGMCMNKSISFYISVGFMVGYWEKVE